MPLPESDKPVPVTPHSWADPVVARSLAVRIMADHGVDEHTPMAMVADVRDRGSDSPHAEIVSAAAQAILAPVIEAFNRVFTVLAKGLQAWASAVSRAFQPVADVLASIEESHDGEAD